MNCGKKETETGKIIIRVNLSRMIVITDNYIVFDMAGLELARVPRVPGTC